MNENNNQYGFETQKVLLSFMVSDPDLFARSRTIIKDDYFDNKLRPAVRFIQDYTDQYKAIPKPVQIVAQCGVEVSVLNDINHGHSEWYLETVEKFCRYRAIENVILDGPELLQKGEGAEIERRLRDAMTITLQRDLGSNYGEDPLARLERLMDKSNIIKTHWPSIDNLLGGGFTKGSLNIFAGGSGSGKSLWMQNLALNWVERGEKVLYITLELSQDLTDNRIDMMVSEMSKSNIFQDIRRAAATISAKVRGHNGGELTTKKFSEAGTTTNDIRAYLKEYEIQKGYRPTRILVDYLDLMYPNNNKVDTSSLFTKDKFVSEELRSLAGDYDLPVVTASQLNRGSVEASEFDHAHIAGGISKINTADNVFAILFTTSMRERGEYELQFLKTRSAAAVGFKVKMMFSKDTLRISDPENNGSNSAPTPSEIRQELIKKETGPTKDGEKVKTGVDDLISRMKGLQK